jgi:SAM-dependent methyltransferase
MITIDSTIRELLQYVQAYQPIQVDAFYKPGWWVQLSEADQLNYIRDLDLLDVDLQGRSFMDIGCAEGYVCFYAEQKGARLVVACDGHGWKYGTTAANPWPTTNPQNMMLVFELLRLLKRSSAVRLVQDVESPDFVDSVRRIGTGKIDIVNCAGVLYHNYNPVAAMRNIFEVTGERAIFSIPDFRDLQKDGRAFTPFHNRLEANDFNYDAVLRYGQANHRIWNLAPEEWASMLRFAGFRTVDTHSRGLVTAFQCTV